MYNEIDLDKVDIMQEPPLEEPMRQYYFMKKARKIVEEESKRLGRRLTADGETFGCPMVYAPQIHGKP